MLNLQLRLRADRRLRYASSPIGAIVPIQRTGEQHQDVEICNPCPPTFLLPISPAGQGEPTASRARGTRAIALRSRTRKTSCTDDSICPRGTSTPLRLKRQSQPKGHKEWHEPGQQVREDTRSPAFMNGTDNQVDR